METTSPSETPMCDYKIVEDNAYMYGADVFMNSGGSREVIERRHEIVAEYMRDNAKGLAPCGKCAACNPPPPPWAT